MQKSCETDIFHEEASCALSADRERWCREAAPLLTGSAAAELRRKEAQFSQAHFDFDSCRRLEEVEQRLKSMRAAVARMEMIVSKATKLKDSLGAAVAKFNALDRRTLSLDPGSHQIYAETAGLLEVLEDRCRTGEVERGIALLNRLEQNIQVLSQHSAHVRQYASREVELWGRVASLCPLVSAPFIDQLCRIPAEPFGDSYIDWITLRQSIGISVLDSTGYIHVR